MKVLSDAANVSPLDTWLREETSASTSTPSPLADSDIAPVVLAAHAPAGPHDSAEGLLNLDVWNGAAPEARVLASASVATRGDARDWAEHVIEPLLR